MANAMMDRLARLLRPRATPPRETNGFHTAPNGPPLEAVSDPRIDDAAEALEVAPLAPGDVAVPPEPEMPVEPVAASPVEPALEPEQSETDDETKAEAIAAPWADRLAAIEEKLSSFDASREAMTRGWEEGRRDDRAVFEAMIAERKAAEPTEEQRRWTQRQLADVATLRREVDALRREVSDAVERLGDAEAAIERSLAGRLGPIYLIALATLLIAIGAALLAALKP